MAVVVDSEEEFKEILESSGSRLIIADFWAEWCGPCRQMMPIFTKLAKDPDFNDAIFLKVDVDELSLDEVSGANKEKLIELIRKYYS